MLVSQLKPDQERQYLKNRPNTLFLLTLALPLSSTKPLSIKTRSKLSFPSGPEWHIASPRVIWVGGAYQIGLLRLTDDDGRLRCVFDA